MKSMWVGAFALMMVSSASVAMDGAAGGEIYADGCIDCHGKSGAGMASFPSISGRDVAYIADRLRTYRAREMVGPNSAIMMSWAEDLSDADIDNLATYISGSFR